MATLKRRNEEELEAEDVELTEQEAAIDEMSEVDENKVYEMLAGYKDKEGIVHKEFTLREMTGRDEEAINKADVKNNGSKLVTTLLIRCVTRIGAYTPKSVGQAKWMDIIRSLYSGDQDFMLFQLRRLSIGDTFEVNHVCPNDKCKEKLHTEIDIDELEIMPFMGERDIPFQLPSGYVDRKGISHKTGTMRLPTALDREILTPVARNNLAKAETIMLTRLCAFDDGLKVDEDIMADLKVRDREYLQKLQKENLFGVKQEFEVTCSTCGESFTGTFSGSNFF